MQCGRVKRVGQASPSDPCTLATDRHLLHIDWSVSRDFDACFFIHLGYPRCQNIHCIVRRFRTLLHFSSLIEFQLSRLPLVWPQSARLPHHSPSRPPHSRCLAHKQAPLLLRIYILVPAYIHNRHSTPITSAVHRSFPPHHIQPTSASTRSSPVGQSPYIQVEHGIFVRCSRAAGTPAQADAKRQEHIRH